MMKKTMQSALIVLLSASALSLSACKDSTTSPTITEFIADSASFKGWMGWTLTKTTKGPDPLLGAMAHGGNDSTVTREVFIKNGQGPSSGKYPVGTLISKYSLNPAGTVNMITAMAKRGNGFNSGYGDWEFFILNPDGSIAKDGTGMQMRGASLMDGMCRDCHSHASTDLVFSK